MVTEAAHPEAKQSDNLWNDVLAGARRYDERLPSKHVLVLGKDRGIRQADEVLMPRRCTVTLGEPGHGKSTLIEHLFDKRTSSLNAFSSSSNATTSKLYTPIQRTAQGSGRNLQGYHARTTGSLRGRPTDQINGSINKDQEPISAGLPALSEEVLIDERLKSTEGMAVDYEWVEVNDADIGEMPKLPLITTRASHVLMTTRLPRQRTFHLFHSIRLHRPIRQF